MSEKTKIRFGPAGNPEDFFENGGESALEMPQYLKNKGLNAYEYQCTFGIKITSDACGILKEEAEKNGIFLSVHAPYFTDISSENDEILKKSVDLLTKTAKVADNMGASRIVMHMGSAKYITRRKGMEISVKTVEHLLNTLRDKNLSHITVCPETMGKFDMMGTYDEVLKLCEIFKNLIPALDFGHINCMMQGKLKSEADYLCILAKFEKKLGFDRMKNFHCHFSKIEFTRAGEKEHLSLDNQEYGPEFEPLAKAIVKMKYEPVIICESIKTQGNDAVLLKNIYDKVVKI